MVLQDARFRFRNAAPELDTEPGVFNSLSELVTDFTCRANCKAFRVVNVNCCPDVRAGVRVYILLDMFPQLNPSNTGLVVVSYLRS